MRSGLLVEGEQLLSSLAIFGGLPLISSHILPARSVAASSLPSYSSLSMKC